MESVQRRATQLVDGLRDKTYEERLSILELSSLCYRRRRGDMIWVFKINGMVRMDSSKLFIPVKNPHPRGHSQKIFKQRASTLTRSNTFSQRIINDWNNLPNYVVEAPTLDTFKSRLDKHWNTTRYDHDGTN